MDRVHNTRHSTPMRRRQNICDKRNTCGNKNYSDNLDIHHLDSPANKKAKKHNVPKSLREPSQTRISAQEMMKMGEIQHSLSPLSHRKLIGTAIKDEKDVKPKIKTEEEIDITVNTRRKNTKWPTDARLVHVDRTPCSTECMKTHKDDSEDDTMVNKSVKATYGQKSLEGVPPKEKHISPVNKISDTPTPSTETDLPNDKETTSEIMDTGSDDIPLHGVPVKETDQRDSKDLDSKIDSAPTDLNHQELHGVPDNPNTIANESTRNAKNARDTTVISPPADQNQQELHGVPSKSGTIASTSNNKSAGTAANALDTLLTNEETTLLAIEQTSTSPDGAAVNPQDNTNTDINLQHELTPETVTMTTGIIDDLSEFGSLLNLNDDLDTDLPLVGGPGNIECLEPIMDLEIVMDNARFIEDNPIHGNGNSTRSDKTSAKAAQKSTKNY